MGDISNFSKALLAAERAVELFEGGPEESNTFHVKADSSLGTLEINGYTAYIQEEGPNRVLAGLTLVGSFNDPVEAIIETMGLVIGDRTKRVLKEFLDAESLT